MLHHKDYRSVPDPSQLNRQNEQNSSIETSWRLALTRYHMALQLRTYDIWILYMYITSACQGPGAHHILRKNLGGKACIDNSDICGVSTDLSVFFGGWRWGFRAATGKCGALSHVAGSLFRWHLGGNDRNAHWWKTPCKLKKKFWLLVLMLSTINPRSNLPDLPNCQALEPSQVVFARIGFRAVAVSCWPCEEGPQLGCVGKGHSHSWFVNVWP